MVIPSTFGLVSQMPYGWQVACGVNEIDCGTKRRRGFRQYYQIGCLLKGNGSDTEPGENGELTEDYDPPHSPFGQIYSLISQGAFTYRDVMRRIPWATILTMINDQGKVRKNEKEEDKIIDSEKEELEFLGL